MEGLEAFNIVIVIVIFIAIVIVIVIFIAVTTTTTKLMCDFESRRSFCHCPMFSGDPIHLFS